MDKICRHNEFKGWYFNHTNDKQTLIFISSCHSDEKGNLRAYLQVITEQFSHCFEYDGKSFDIDKDSLKINIGNSVFSEEGLVIDIEQDGFCAKGRLSYSDRTPLKSDIMGPFRFMPFMQCRHGVISMYHTVNGTVSINGKNYLFDNGTGYIENDSGSTFPKKYLWTQCNINNVSVMLSIATIKTCIGNMEGTISAIMYNGKEYRLATYLGANILLFGQTSAIIKQGKYLLIVKQVSSNPKKLKASVQGKMVRTIRESPSCRVEYAFYEDDEPLFCFESDRASFEYSDNKKE